MTVYVTGTTASLVRSLWAFAPDFNVDEPAGCRSGRASRSAQRMFLS